MKMACVLSICLASAALAAPRADWPAWRGAERTGVSSEKGLARSWPEAGPPLLWTASGLGEGFSTPSIADGVLYVLGNRDGKEQVIALDARARGKELWATTLGDVRHGGAGYPGPRSTPTVDGDRLYVLGINGDLACLVRKTGKLVWQRDLVKDFGGTIPNWGYSESVLIDGPWALCTPGGQQATIVALNKTTGKEVWAAKVGDPTGYSSILPAQIAGVKQYLQFTSQGLISVRAKDGELLWRYDAPANGTANCSTPLNVGDKVFAASGYGTGGGLVSVARSGAGQSAEEVYFTKNMKNHHGGMVVVDGYLYGSNDPGILTCLDFETGDVKWADRTCGKGSVVCVDGMLIVRSEKGPVSLVKASPDEFELLGRFDQPDRSDAPSWPHPVVAGGKLYLRDQDKLFCYAVAGE